MKNKKRKQIMSWLLTVSVIAMYLFLPPVTRVEAVSSIYNASNLISDSDFGVTGVTHTVTFTTSTTTKQNDYFDLVFPAGFTNVGSGVETCPPDYTPTVNGQIVTCTYDEVAEVPPATDYEIVVTGVTNPLVENLNGYSFYLNHYDTDDNMKERVEIKVYIISSVRMTAHVNAILTFSIDGMTDAESVNGVDCDMNTWATSTDFGTLAPTASTTVCQELRVGTNATQGYIVTVEQDNELLSSANDTINSFIDSPDTTGSSTAVNAWQSPAGVLDVDETYGHMGLTSDDSDLSSLSLGAYLDFYNSGTALYAGFNDTDPIVVMHHDGPTTNDNQDTGLAHVAYTAEISVLQQAGDYQNQLTYIATATY